MSPERWRQIEELFHAALEQEPACRAAFVEQACAGDEALCREVLSLVDSHQKASPLFEAPVLPPSPSAGQRIGAYQIEREISRGGMGAVYLASRADQQYEKQVAIKLVRAELAGEFVLKRFRTERQILADLEHPNIARLLDGGVTADGRPFLVMEYVEGVPLDEYCDRERLSIAERLKLFTKICSAVSYAHQQLVVHRDLKPSNILVTESAEPKLLDFGIAKLIEAPSAAQDPTVTGHLLLTPSYASPEQVSGGKVTTASDIYSLGVLLYELLTGQRPYQVEDLTPLKLARAIIEQEPQRPSAVIEGYAAGSTRAGSPVRLRRRLAGDLDNIVLMALRKDPERRYRSVEQFSEDLRRHLEGRPVIARQDTLAYRSSKFIRRHQAGVAAAAALVLALVGGTVVSTNQARVANRERVKAEKTTNFVQRMLGAADASWASSFRGKGRELKVADVLDSAAERVGSELNDQPEVEAALRRTLGLTYRTLGLYEPAQHQLQEGLAKQLSLYGENHPETALSLSALGTLFLLKGDYGPAEGYLRRAMAVQRKLNPDSARTADLDNDLGILLLQRGKSDEAEVLLKESVQLCRKYYGATVRLALALGNLGLIYDNRGDLGRAGRHYQEAIDAFRKTPSPPAMEMAWSLLNLGGVCKVTGRYADAENLFRESLSVFRSALGETHPNLALPMVELALVGSHTGDHQKAAALVHKALEIQRKSLPAEHPDIARSLTALGEVLTAAGRPAEAELHLRQALAIRRKLYPQGNRRIADTAGVLGNCLVVRGRYGEAEALLEESYRGFRAAFGESHPRTHEALERLADILRAEGRPATPAEVARTYSQ